MRFWGWYRYTDRDEAQVSARSVGALTYSSEDYVRFWPKANISAEGLGRAIIALTFGRNVNVGYTSAEQLS